MKDADLEKMRHTLSHVLAAAVGELYPTVMFGIGPAIDEGFYYDIDFGKNKVSDTDLIKIEQKMREIIAEDLEMTKENMSRTDALNWARENKQQYKIELIENLSESEEISFYNLGKRFKDLCRGPHIKNTAEIKAFKLVRVAGAYWQGDEKREMLTRIYGVAFETQAELNSFLERQEEAKMRDHRKLGKELELFCFSDLVGAGLPLFTPRGTELRELVANYSLSLRGEEGFRRVWTPHITKMDLYKTSGHYAKFGDELFIVHSQVNGEDFAMKPMNCPHHAQIFASRPRSYREMPVRYMEATTDYRDEKTGELGGLSRVRALTQDDSHVFCRNDQIKDEVGRLVSIVRKLYGTMGMVRLRARLSYRNEEDKYLGDKKLWMMAQEQIKQAAIDNNLDYFEQEGEAAFYGPKIDFMAEDALGREHQLATVQLDFVQPERFKLEFVNVEGQKEQPVMIHHATLGSIERFLSVFIEHTGGWFPFWCAPEQVRMIVLREENEKMVKYVEKIKQVLSRIVLDEPLKYNELRWSVDETNDSLGKKIKRATELKIPMILIVGPRDLQAKEISVRLRDKEEKIKLTELDEYCKKM